MVSWWWQWLAGYVVCRVRKGDRQALLDLFLAENVDVWNVVELPDDGTIAFCLSLSDYRRIVGKTKRLPVRIEILDKRGLPFSLWRARKRKSFWAGAFVFIVGLALTFHMVWTVEVVGNEQIATDELLAAAAQLGLREGVFRHRLPSHETVQAELLSRFPDLTWVGVEITGTKVTLRVVEGKRPQRRPLVNPRHLVAAKSGIVKEIFVEQGTARVSRNQLVKKGDILIAGYMGVGENRRIVSAQGIVQGLVWYEVSASVPLVQEVHRLSGKRYTKTSLLIGSRLVSLGGSGPVYSQYKVEQTVRPLRVGPWTLPVGVHEKTVYETYTERRTLSRAEALALAKRRARDRLLHDGEKDAEVVVEKVLHETVVSGTLKVKLYYEVLEDITREMPILHEREPGQQLPQPSA